MVWLKDSVKKEYQKYLEKKQKRINEKGETIIVDSEIPVHDSYESLTFGILGTGHVFDRWMHDFSLLSEKLNLHVKGIYSFDLKTAAEKAEQYDISIVYSSYEDMLADPEIDAIYIATPNHVHCDNALKALKAGKHTLCEKPIAVNTKELNEMFELADKTGCFLMEGLWMRTLPMIRKLKEIVESGTIGEVRLIETSCCNSDDPKTFPALFSPERAGGALMDVGCYGLHFVRLIMNGEPDIVSSIVAADTGVDSVTTAVLKTDRMIATVTQSIVAAGGAKALIHGTAGSIEIPLFLHPYEFTVTTTAGFKQHYKYDSKNKYIGYAYETAHFAECIHSQYHDSRLIPREDTLLVASQMEQIRYNSNIRLGSELRDYE